MILRVCLIHLMGPLLRRHRLLLRRRASHDDFIGLRGGVAATIRKGSRHYMAGLEKTGALFNPEPIAGLGTPYAGAKALGRRSGGDPSPRRSG